MELAGSGGALGSQLTPLSPRLLAWQAWRLDALGDIDLHFARQAWHLWHCAGFGGAVSSQLTPLSPRLLPGQAWHLVTWTFTLRGTRGPWQHRPVGVGGGDIDLHFAWQAWHLWHWAGSGGALGSQLPPLSPLAGVALGDINLHFAWQAWHL